MKASKITSICHKKVTIVKKRGVHSFTPPNMHQQRNTFSNKSMIMCSFLKLALFVHTTPGQEIQLQALSFHCWKPHSVDVNRVFIWYIMKLLKAVLCFPKAPQKVPASLCKWRFYFRAQMFQKLTGLKDLYMWYLYHFYRKKQQPCTHEQEDTCISTSSTMHSFSI